MAVFEYRGLVAASGKQVHGVRDADNAKVLRAVLRREGVMLTAAQEDKAAKRAEARNIDLFAFARRVSVGDVAMMTRQLATLVTAGIPLVEAVAALTDQVEKLELKRVLTQVRDRLNEGTSLAKALEPHPKIFPNLYVNMVAAGEASGTLEQVLARLSDFMEGQSKLRGKVGAALAYPALMVVIGTVLISIMMVVVVPKVTSIFASLDKALPWYTELLITVSSAMSSSQFFGVVITIATVNLARKALENALIKIFDPRLGIVQPLEVGTIHQIPRLFHHQRTVHHEKRLLRNRGFVTLAAGDVGIGKIELIIDLRQIAPVN